MPRLVATSPRDPAVDLVGEPAGSTYRELAHLRAVELLIARKALRITDLAVALRQAHNWGSSVAQTLIAAGKIRAMDYYRTLAEVYELPFVDLQQQPIDPDLVSVDDRLDYAARHIVPWRRINGRLVLAATEITADHFVWGDARFGTDNYDFVITSPFDILWQTQALFRDWDSLFAREALHAWKPEHSAKFTTTKAQRMTLCGAAALLLAAALLAPRATAVTVMAAFTLLYLVTFVFKFVLTVVGSSRRADVDIPPEALAAMEDVTLPPYTVLVPMYREAKVLPLIARALKNLDYPPSKLEVKLVLEEDDAETIEAAKALRLPGTFEIVRVPASQPKTKPKACNYALQFCRGEIVTIYDAEDQPEPDQLKKAVYAFRYGDPRLACVQGRLNYFNRSENWLTRMFTLEYSQWFDFLLPGLDWLKVPIPLGGTSNHFKLAALRQVGAWDPYNVTEDADLGIRLAQEGYTVGVINSTTYEEANGVLPSWIKQRSRWIKGYMQTWIVHMRHPIQLWRSVGTKGFFSFHFFIGAPPFTVLFAPILWALTLAFWLTRGTDFGWLMPGPIGAMAVFNLLVGNLFLIYFGVIAALKRRYYELVPVGLMLPAYWVLHSIAAYKAFWQLLFRPHYWEKTEHGTSAITQKSLAAVKGDAA
jgi:cellulose synthase/poly-beta-1,6-N-acetylglucosamine synthase-like glycosyltransferase